MDETDYTLCEYFANEEGESMIGLDGSASTAWENAGILCNLCSLGLERHRRMPAQALPLFPNLLYSNPSPLNLFS